MVTNLKQPMRVYADTSVYGGAFDDEFAEPSRAFFDRVHEGRFQLIVSAIVLNEIEPAPQQVRDLLDEMLTVAEVADVSDGALALQQAYLDHGIVSSTSADDALHVALATTGRCAMIVSWNFRHIVHYRKVPLYNAVNTLHGLATLEIRSPLEVIEDDD